MADENIVVTIQDKVATTIATKLAQIANTAGAAASQVDRLQASINAVNATKLQTTLNASTSSASQLSNSINALAVGMSTLTASMGGMGSALAGIQSSLQSLEASIGGVGSEIQALTQAVQGLNTQGGGMKSNVVTFAAFGIALQQVIGYAKDLGDAVTALVEWRAGADRARIGIEQVSGSVSGAAANTAFLSQTVNKLGLDLNGATQGFIKLAAATQGTALQGQATQQIFTSLSEEASVLHLNSDQLNGSLLALSQMAGKGTVQMQELKLQLGNNLPDAMQLAAKAMGVTVQQLDSMISSGQVVTEDFLPKFAQAMHDKYAGSVSDASDSAQASLNRFSTAWTNLERTIGASKIGDAAKSALGTMIDALDHAANAIQNFQKMSFWQFINTDLNKITSAPPTTVNPSAGNLSAAQQKALSQQNASAYANSFITGTGSLNGNSGGAKFLTQSEQLAKNLSELAKEQDKNTAAFKAGNLTLEQYNQTVSVYNSRVDGLNQKAAKPGLAKAHKDQQNQLNAQLTALQGNATQIKNVYDQETNDIATALSNQQITQAEAIVKQGELKDQELAKLRDVAQQGLVLAQGKDQLSARQKFKDQINDYSEQIVTNETKVQSQLAALQAKTALQAQQILASFTLQGQQRNTSNQNSLDALGFGSQGASDLQKIQQIQNQAAQDRQKLTDQATKDGEQYSTQYIAGINAITVAEHNQIADEQSFFQQRNEMQSDWLVGLKAGVNDFIDTSSNVAKSTEQTFTQTFGSMNDALAAFVTTGKLNFGSLATSIIQDIIKIQLQADESAILKTIMGAVDSSFDSTGAFGFSGSSSTATTGGAALMGLGGSSSFALGGFTGAGGKYQPAGIVHKGEYVFDQDATRRIGVGNLSRLAKGYANGGYVGGSSGNAMATSQMNVVINNNASDKVSATAQQGTDSNGNPTLDIMINTISSRLAGQVASGRGQLHDSIQSKFGLQSRPGK